MRVICCYSNGWVACSGLEWQAGCDEGWLGWMWTTAGGDRERQISPHVDRRRRGGGIGSSALRHAFSKRKIRREPESPERSDVSNLQFNSLHCINACFINCHYSCIAYVYIYMYLKL